ncbi:MAG: oligosaccharide flippase family protein [Candidatus Thermoplasmatota archaeon]|jgi:O-antigen/teichoic acid export membrane protein|nr:oligosaccharide flippase family protein [Candidatus Thermoplasmatota archaeon]MCL5984918.1 oligosaccharide flippase family protein [Candidatus Thermoplasmatota archaeon]
MSTPTRRESHSLESLGRGSLLYLVGQLVLIGATFGSRVLMVRSLSTSDYGDITLGLATVAVITPLASLGIPYGIARQIAHSKDVYERHHLMVLAMALATPLAIASGVALFLAAPVMATFVGTPAMTVVLRFASAYLAISILSGTVGSINQGEERMLPLTVFNMVVTPLLLLGFLVAFFSTGASLSLAILSYVLASAGGFLGISIYTFGSHWRKIRESLSAKNSEYGRRLLKDLLLFSAPLTMMGIATVVTGNVDALVLGFLGHPVGSVSTTSIVGTYSAVITVSRLLTLGVASFAVIMLPVSARLHRAENVGELGKSYATMTKWILAIFFPLYTIFMLVPGPTLLLIYGPVTQTSAFSDSATVLRITATGAILTVLIGPAQSVLTGLGRLRLLFYDTVAAAAIDVFGSLLLVPSFGVYGAATAFALSTAALPVFAVAQTGILVRVHAVRQQVLAPLVVFIVASGLILGIAVYGFGWVPGTLSLVLLYFVLFFTYLGAILLTRSTEIEDLYLLGVFEKYLGRPIPILHRIVLRFEGKSSGEESPDE